MFRELFETRNMKDEANQFIINWNGKGSLSNAWEQHKKELFDSGLINQKEFKRWGNPFKGLDSEASFNKVIEQRLNMLNKVDQQRFKIITLDRERTNYDTNWQKEYFYGDLKDKSKSDSKWYMQKWIILFPDQIQGKRVKESDLVKYYVKNPKKYFANL